MAQATTPAPDAQPLVGASEAASMMGIELSTFSHLRRREEQIEGSKFPKPLAVLRCGPIWKTSEIRRFAARYTSPRPGPKPIPAEVMAKAKADLKAKVDGTPTPTPIKAVAKANGAKPVKKTVAKPVAKKTVAKKAVAKKVPAAV